MAQVAGVHIEQLTYGVWFMAAIVAYLIIPKPGIALIAEFAAGAGETIVMGKFDIPTIVYAILQGLACEIIFAIFKYKSRSLMVAILAGLATALISFPVDYYYGYWLKSQDGIFFYSLSSVLLAVLSLQAYYLI